MVHHTSIQNALIRFGHQMASIWFKHIFSCMTLSLTSNVSFFFSFTFKLWTWRKKTREKESESKVKVGQIYKLRVNGWDVCWFICGLSDFMKCSTLTFHRYKIIYSAGVLLEKRDSILFCYRFWSRFSAKWRVSFFFRTPASKQKLERKTPFSGTWIYHHWDACTHLNGQNQMVSVFLNINLKSGKINSKLRCFRLHWGRESESESERCMVEMEL